MAARRGNGCGSTARRMGSGESQCFERHGHLMEANRRKSPASLPGSEEGQAPREHKEMLEPEGRCQRLLPVGAAIADGRPDAVTLWRGKGSGPEGT